MRCGFRDTMECMSTPVLAEQTQVNPLGGEVVAEDRPWRTIVWNDPVNLMSYVTYVFQHVFGYPKKKATKLMLDVHHKGRAVVAAGARESMERNVEILHGYGLWATVKQDK